MATTTQTTIDTLNSLLRGELSACETYEQALQKFEGRVEAVELRQIHQEHEGATNTLRPVSVQTSVPD